VLDVAVHVPVGEQADQVKGLAALAHTLDEFLPYATRLALEERPALDCPLYELRTLGKNSPGTQRVVTHLAVAHVSLARHADRGAVGPEAGGGSVRGEPVQVGRVGKPDRVRLVVPANAHAVHHAHDDWAGNARGNRVRSQTEGVLAHPVAATSSAGRHFHIRYSCSSSS